MHCRVKLRHKGDTEQVGSTVPTTIVTALVDSASDEVGCD